MLKLNAWILDVGNGLVAAVGGRELMHLVDMPITYPVPYTPTYCRQVVLWQGSLIPVVDLANLSGCPVQEPRYVAIVGYQQERGGEVQFGAVSLANPPKQIGVSDEQVCELPDSWGLMRKFISSCFEYQELAVPVISVKRLFCTPPV